MKRNRRRRIIAYGSLALILYLGFLWIPWEYDLFQKPLPSPNPPVDPDRQRLFSPGTKVLLVTAHPDDSAFYIGSFLHKLGKAGAEIHQVIVTDGDKAYYGPFTDRDANRRVRRGEAEAELLAWGGKSIKFLGFPDGRLGLDDDARRAIRREIDRLQPEYMLIFDGVYPPRLSHRDHRRAGILAEGAAQGARSVRWIMRFSTRAPNFVEDTSDFWVQKRKLLAIHASQFNGERLERVENMVEERAIDEGGMIDKTYGEGFRVSLLP